MIHPSSSFIGVKWQVADWHIASSCKFQRAPLWIFGLGFTYKIQMMKS